MIRRCEEELGHSMVSMACELRAALYVTAAGPQAEEL